MKGEGNFSLHAEIPRELFEDKPAVTEWAKHVWRDAVRHFGGDPITETPDIQEGPKYRDGERILPFMDDEGWDFIGIRIVGKAYREFD